MSPSPLQHPGPFEPYDERDSVFARTRLVPGSSRYEAYYARRPENRTADDRTRALPSLASPGGKRYRPAEAALVEGCFEASDLVASAVEQGGRGATTPEGLGTAHDTATDGPRHELGNPSAAELSRLVKQAALFLGADDVGIAPLRSAFVYSHRGRPLERFGEPVELGHGFAVVLVFAMRHGFVASGPEMIATAETARVYQQTGAACFALAQALRRSGFETRAHVDSNYLVICPPLAVEAGLGELGRNGVLIHPVHGPGVRLGVVTVKAELEPDRPGCWGIADFCRVCAKCAHNCPSRSIPEGDPVVSRGALKWPLEPERCYHYWRSQGTDCGVCLRSCPFAKPDTLLHRVVRKLIAVTTLVNRPFLWADDLLYGAEAEPARPPLLGIGPP